MEKKEYEAPKVKELSNFGPDAELVIKVLRLEIGDLQMRNDRLVAENVMLRGPDGETYSDLRARYERVLEAVKTGEHNWQLAMHKNRELERQLARVKKADQ
jgi:hypothetical protein